MIGKTISHYRILEKLGEGGVGVVYKAEDLKLKRTVALKFLSPQTLSSDDDRTRFVHEAQAAAALRHPGICTVYQIDEADGQIFIVMEYVEGESLKQKIASKDLSQEETLDLISQIAAALQEAHENKIVHRDIKPANILVTPKGHAVITDFGLAKSGSSAQVTRTGTTVGTAAYMSPEQARGDDVDHRTDIWSVGVILYQMLTGQLPFRGEFEHAVIYSVLNSEPETPTNINSDLPKDLANVVLKTLQKDPGKRHQSLRELNDALAPFRIAAVSAFPSGHKPPSLFQVLKKPAVLIPAVIIIALISFLSLRYAGHAAKVRWARKVALPEIITHVERDEYFKAFDLARDAKEIIPSDPILLGLWADVSVKSSFYTVPEGARVYMKKYDQPENEWEYIGQSPIDSAEVAKGFFRWRIEKDGYQPVEAAGSGGRTFRYMLDEKGTIPEGMVKIPSGTKRHWLGTINRFETIEVTDFLMDRYEVTNEQFKEFVDSGGYQNRAFWKHDFVDDGRVLSWNTAIERFRDPTGKPGPATWELGTYLKGREKHPVTGVSWYEAAAYAEFVKKSLPTVHHWLYAGSIRASAHIIPMSNFSAQGLAPAGSYQGVNVYGAYDMAGNAREWCFNSDGVEHFILGGCWNDPSYMFHFLDTRSAFDRSPGNGFRCVKFIGEDSTLVTARRNLTTRPTRDYNQEKPVSDDILEAYLSIFSYDRTPLNSRVDFVDDKPEHWKIEKISFDAAYGNERMFAYLFLPRQVSPPYQTMVLFPGASAMESRSSENGNDLHSWDAVDFAVKSGRAVLYPVYKSTYERGDGYDIYDPNTTMTAHRDHVVMWWKDLARSVDYLETRVDIDHDKLCYYGSSHGAWIAPIFLGQDKRFRAAILRLGGLPLWKPDPPIDPINFIQRVKIPALMINGRYDYLFPHETSQVPMFETFGTPVKDKRHVVFETAHSVYGHRNEMIRETLDWLDRYLGPAK